MTKKCEQGTKNGTKYKGKDEEYSTKNVNMVQKMWLVYKECGKNMKNMLFKILF